jgi:hypothetical protein
MIMDVKKGYYLVKTEDITKIIYLILNKLINVKDILDPINVRKLLAHVIFFHLRPRQYREDTYRLDLCFSQESVLFLPTFFPSL